MRIRSVMPTYKPAVASVVVAILALATTARAAEPNDVRSSAVSSSHYTFDITGQTLTQALKTYAQTTNQQIIFTEDLVAGREAPVLKGEFTAEAALFRLLDRTGLTVERSPSGALMIKRPDSVGQADSFKDDGQFEFRLVQNTEANSSTQNDEARNSPLRTASVASETQESRAPSTERKTGAAAADEVVVTGSHIRGAKSSASPVFVYDKEEIRKSGYANTQEFIRSLPQTFGGGMADTSMGAILGGEGANYNFANASAANLRGLGNRGTLTLLNGRRLAPASIGDGVDLSIIPLNAVERIDVLTDGASAIYGSDAVGGVVNIILRKGYEGAQTSLRYGSVTSGSHQEMEASQTLGHSWSSGDAILSYSYYDRTPLSTDERPYMAGSLFAGYDLVPIMERQNAMLNLRQDLGERMTLSMDGLYSVRDTEYDYVASNGTVPVLVTPRSTSYGGSAGLQIDLGGSWQADVGGIYNRSITKYRTLQNNAPATPIDMMSDVSSIDAKFDGNAFSAPGGAAKLALGAQYRRDGFDSFGRAYSTGGKDTRNVKGVFGELFVPLFGERNARTGAQRLELSVAGRAEDYSDFGSTSNPKIGLLWAPVDSVSLRGTFGTSYRAPQLYELSENASMPRAYTYVMFNNAGVRNINTLVIYGNNRNLKAEEAEMWTAGIDIAPEALGGVKLGLTYFDVDYTDRISQPVADGDFFYVMTKPNEYASVTQLNPSTADINNWVNRPGFLNLSNIPVSSVTAIIDQRLINVSGVKEQGLDFDLSYSLPSGIGNFEINIGGTYLFERLHQVTPTAPAIETLNTVFYPADLKLRNSIGWSQGGFGATVFVNYVDSYEDRRAGYAVAEVSSWTTLDLSLRYDTPATAGRILSGLAFGLNAQNVFNRDPPYVYQAIGVHMDPTNASPVGRFLSLNVTKSW